MWRWIRNTFILFSLLICIAASIFWVRSWSTSELLRYENSLDQGYVLRSIDQRLVLAWYDVSPAGMTGRQADAEDAEWVWVYEQDEHEPIEDGVVRIREWSDRTWEFLGFGYFGLSANRNPQPQMFAFFPGSFEIIVIPYWFIVPLTALWPLWWLWRGRQSSRRYRRKHGLCVKCGYDLRGSTDACPECGRAVTPSTKVT